MGRKKKQAQQEKTRNHDARRNPAKATVFLGGGRITSALIAGLRLAGYEGPIVVHDHNPEKLQALRREFRIEAAADLKSAVPQAGTLIIAVRPTAVAGLLDEIAHSAAITRPIVAISLAAGIPLKKLGSRLGPPVLWARAMPSPVCRIGRGLTAIAFDRRVPRPSRDQVHKFFAQVGPVLELPETQFDAFNAAYSPSHGYHALATLADATQACGLDRKTAVIVAAHALADALVYWRQRGETVADLLEESATPGGTSAATMAAMKKSGYEKAVAAGLKAGIKRARRNARL
jgi:pyrroline-5-carboxylate reductase